MELQVKMTSQLYYRHLALNTCVYIGMYCISMYYFATNYKFYICMYMYNLSIIVNCRIAASLLTELNIVCIKPFAFYLL